MEKLEMVQKLQERTGLSAEDAWNALEKNNWVLVDAMLWLEREKGIQGQTASASTQDQQKEANFLPVKPVLGKEQSQEENPILTKLKLLLSASMQYHLVVRKKGETLLRLPLLVMAIFLAASFYVVLTAILVGLVLGCQITVEQDQAQGPAQGPAQDPTQGPAQGQQGPAQGPTQGRDSSKTQNPPGDKV